LRTTGRRLTLATGIGGDGDWDREGGHGRDRDLERGEMMEQMGQETVNEEPTKTPRDDDEEEQEMLAVLAEWRNNWAGTWSDYYGSIDKRSE
jgi:hypothetical protein